jgi:hypothetical protein
MLRETLSITLTITSTSTSEILLLTNVKGDSTYKGNYKEYLLVVGCCKTLLRCVFVKCVFTTTTTSTSTLY